MPHPKLTESDVRKRIDARSFQRGMGYFREGRIVNPRLQGDWLKARCLGSTPQPYYVEVRLGSHGVAEADCSCPIGFGGYCKHVAALLLTWIHEPETFAQVEPLDVALEKRSKAELITLVRQMIARYPDLETMLDLPIAGGGAKKPVTPEVIKDQVNQILFSGAHGEWGVAYDIGRQLEALTELGDDYIAAGNYENAAVVYETAMREILDNYGMFHDEEGELHRPVDLCVAGLGECLEMTDDRAFREELLGALFHVLRWDIEFGGIDMGYEAPHIILEHTTPEERLQVAAWVREALPTEENWSSSFRRQAWGRFLLKLEEELLDDEDFLRLCQETERWGEMVDRLLTLDRVQEAADVVRGVADYELVRLVDLFVEHDHADVGEELVRQRVAQSDDSRLTAWLVDRAREKGDLKEALVLHEILFWKRPDLTGYGELRALAEPLGLWNTLRPKILERLDTGDRYDLLTRIYLEEGEIDAALEAVDKLRDGLWYGQGKHVIQVAEAAEESRPRESIRLYRKQIERLIDARGRGNYQTAVSYLHRLRELYRRLGAESDWQALVTRIREDNPRLRALKDELNKAGM